MKPTTLEVRPLVDRLYARHAAGCCLHIVLDDGNTDDRSVRHCIGTAIRAGHWPCAALAYKLLAMSKTQRRKLAQ